MRITELFTAKSIALDVAAPDQAAIIDRLGGGKGGPRPERDDNFLRCNRFAGSLHLNVSVAN